MVKPNIRCTWRRPSENHFRTVKKRAGLKSKTVPLDEVFQWQKVRGDANVVLERV